MVFKHLFKVGLDWKMDSTNASKKCSRNHQLSIEGKPILDVSAAKAFKGDPSLYNPEDLLLSSVTSCHMMSYLYCCTQHNIEVVAYTDNSEAFLEVNEDGSGKIVKVILNPVVTIADINQSELAKSLHIKANQLCFIANSCSFPIEHHATIKGVDF
ncbi:peroxiredoxin [Chishuiella changwenlii]|nr:OsmC family protein [Chishuiella changwenlii]GGF01793.1 peroxiredoxin [Chishuiella changwenlii]